MAFDPDRVSTVTFDSYSTLVDVDAAERALADRVADPDAAVAAHLASPAVFDADERSPVERYVVRHTTRSTEAGVSFPPDCRGTGSVSWKASYGCLLHVSVRKW